MYTASFCKLRSGAWGVKVQGSAPIAAGSPLEVKTRAGEVKQVTLTSRVWEGNGASIWAIAADRPQASAGSYRRYSSPRTGCSCGSREGESRPSDCWTCRHDAE